MKRKLLLIVSLAMTLMLTSCDTFNGDGEVPDFGDESFTNHVPWWVTNTVAEVK